MPPNKRSFKVSNKSHKDDKGFHWCELPIELKHKIFQATKVKGLAKLAITSKSTRQDILAYLLTNKGLDMIKKQLQLAKAPYAQIYLPQNCDILIAFNLGLLFKCVTTLCVTRDRVIIVRDFHRKVKELLLAFGENWYFTFCGHFLRGFISGWERVSILHGHEILQIITGVRKLVDDTLLANSGTFCTDEMYIRQYYRLIYLNPERKDMKGFWLATILKKFPYVNQAKLIHILYGPLTAFSGGFIDWEAPAHYLPTFLSYDIQEMSHVVSSLFNDCRFSEDHILTLALEITAIPHDWHPLNIAHFFMACGEPILASYMGNLLTNGRFTELSTFIVLCATINLRLARSMEPLIKVLSETATAPEQRAEDKRQFMVSFLEILADHDIIEAEVRYYGLDESSLKRSISTIIDSISNRVGQVFSRGKEH